MYTTPTHKPDVGDSRMLVKFCLFPRRVYYYRAYSQRDGLFEDEYEQITCWMWLCKVRREQVYYWNSRKHKGEWCTYSQFPHTWPDVRYGARIAQKARAKLLLSDSRHNEKIKQVPQLDQDQ